MRVSLALQLVTITAIIVEWLVDDRWLLNPVQYNLYAQSVIINWVARRIDIDAISNRLLKIDKTSMPAVVNNRLFGFHTIIHAIRIYVYSSIVVIYRVFACSIPDGHLAFQRLGKKRLPPLNAPLSRCYWNNDLNGNVLTSLCDGFHWFSCFTKISYSRLHVLFLFGFRSITDRNTHAFAKFRIYFIKVIGIVVSRIFTTSLCESISYCVVYVCSLCKL